jgi:hypothetical protein
VRGRAGLDQAGQPGLDLVAAAQLWPGLAYGLVATCLSDAAPCAPCKQCGLVMGCHSWAVMKCVAAAFLYQLKVAQSHGCSCSCRTTTS